MERSHEQTRDALSEWLTDNHPKDTYPWIKSVFDSTFVYQYDGKLWRRTFTFSDDGALTVGEAEEVQEAYEPVVKMSVFEIGQARFSGDEVLLTGKIFEAGDYPDKGINISEEDLRRAASAFRAVPNDIEHMDTILSGKIGQLKSVVAKGKELFGTVSIPKWFSDVVGADPIKVSLAWNRDSKTIGGNALVLNPRIGDAAVAAFSTHERSRNAPRIGGAMDIISKIKKALGLLPDGEKLTADETAAVFSGLAGPSPTPTPAAPSAEEVKLREEIRKRDDAALKVAAAKFANDQVTEKKALSSERAHIETVYFHLAKSDASARTGQALFSDDGAVLDGDALKALTAIFAARPKLNLTEEQLKDPNIVVMSAGDGGKPAIDSNSIYEKRRKAMTGGN